jgi:DNA-binding response OmpR family regulator
VLIVDDDRDTREMYCEALRADGFEPSIAASGEAALRAASDSAPAIVVTDLRLGGKMDGAELARRLRADSRTERTRIIMLTGAVVGDDRARADAAGCDRLLLKPCLPATLAAEIRQVIVAGISPGDRLRRHPPAKAASGRRKA